LYPLPQVLRNAVNRNRDRRRFLKDALQASMDLDFTNTKLHKHLAKVRVLANQVKGKVKDDLSALWRAHGCELP
jgi:hypothetical protein